MRFISVTRTVRTTAAAVALVATVLAPAARAAEYQVDPAHSEVLFKVKHMTISTVSGNFGDFAGTFEFDPASRTLQGVDAVIQTASISTNNERRDGHLKSDDFFNAEKYPTITFKSTKVTPGKDGHYDLTGDLTIRDKTRPVTLDAVLGGTVKDMQGKDRAAFTATGKINRQDFGVSWNKSLDNGGLVVSDEVQIQISVEAVQSAGAGPKTD